MSRNENANLVLRTIDIQMVFGYSSLLSNANNDMGTFQSRGQYLVWKNVNIRHLLGPLWDKYEMFNLSLKTVIKASSSATNNNYACSIWMTGLNFINRTYDIKTKTLTREACVGGCDLFAPSTATGTGAVFHFEKYNAMFRKGNPIVDLTIQLKNSDGNVYTFNDGRVEMANATNGHMEFIFDIYPIKGYETKPNQRLF